MKCPYDSGIIVGGTQCNPDYYNVPRIVSSPCKVDVFGKIFEFAEPGEKEFTHEGVNYILIAGEQGIGIKYA